MSAAPPIDVPFTVVHDPRTADVDGRQLLWCDGEDLDGRDGKPFCIDEPLPIDRREYIIQRHERALAPGWVETWGMRWPSAGRRDAFFVIFVGPAIFYGLAIAWSLGERILHPLAGR